MVRAIDAPGVSSVNVDLRRCRHGEFWVFENDTTLSRALVQYGEWAENEIYLLAGLLRPGDFVVDAGAHVGTHTLPMASATGPHGRVMAIEAQHDAFLLLSANVLLNAADNVRCIQAVLSDRRGVELLPVAARGTVMNRAAVSFSEDPSETADSVATLRIRIDDLELRTCNLLKMDVEGMELDVLRGAKETIAEHRPVVYFEQNTDRQFGACCEFLREFGYRLFWHVAPAFNGNNFCGSPDNIFGEVTETAVLALPPGATPERARSRAELEEIRSTSYTPPSGRGRWKLPERPYPFYENGAYAPVNRAISSLDAEGLRTAYEVLLEDRAKAQAVMEAQKALIDKFKRP